MIEEGTLLKGIMILTAFLAAVSALIEQGSYYPHKQQPPYNSVIKDSYMEGRLSKPSQLPRVIDECMFISSEPGQFKYVAQNDDEKVCGVYLLTDPDRVVKIHFLQTDIPCDSFGLVSVVDGWELNGELFPSAQDHPLPLEQRVNEFCGNKVPRIFRSSQNVALIQYRIPKAGSGFTIFVDYPRNPMPCNVLAVSSTESFTLRNYGNRVNCSYTALYPSIVQISSLAVGPFDLYQFHRFLQDGISHKCSDRSPQDQAIIGGSYGLDTSKIQILDSICGVNTKSDYRETVEYGVTTVRLMSSGHFNNFVTIEFKPIGEEALAFDF